ncbi:hypothetical protein BVG16_22805 [Paenibacillus selenitireducens]|uniref:DinB-like domain-containing protein n=1 Tax=Paenibacillus selenitireducens TaxID=1324314 RepID=A0A1T2X401_9BACL|nr:DinB family protein [Paenibacillus selenitireducens]OPA74599.1 hypothetical protein BVG16_22805 [Paenibacillus selenitireducens]
MMVASVLHQIRLANESILTMCEQLRDVDLSKRPHGEKRSIWELLTHLAVLCQADLLISNEATSIEMTKFYDSHSFHSLDDIMEGLRKNYEDLVAEYTPLNNEQLAAYTTSYWGVRYSKYEWLLEILGHLYHHRGQLYTMLTYEQVTVRVSLFE